MSSRCDDNFLMNFDASNPGSALFAATQGQVTTPWCGPIVVCRQTLPKEDWNDDVGEDEWQGTVKVLDMDMAAFSQATSMLIDHASGTSRHGFGKGKKLQCVELACGRQGENPKPHTVMLLPRTHPMLEEEPEISGVSEVLFSLPKDYADPPEVWLTFSLATARNPHLVEGRLETGHRHAD